MTVFISVSQNLSANQGWECFSSYWAVRVQISTENHRNHMECCEAMVGVLNNKENRVLIWTAWLFVARFIPVEHFYMQTWNDFPLTGTQTDINVCSLAFPSAADCLHTVRMLSFCALLCCWLLTVIRLQTLAPLDLCTHAVLSLTHRISQTMHTFWQSTQQRQDVRIRW